MARTTPQELAAKWAKRTKAATPEYQAGIRRVTEAPGVAAAREADRMVAGVQEAVSSGKWQERVAGVSLGSWQQSAIDKGTQRIAAGVDGAESDMAQFATELLQFEDNLVAQLPPKGDLAANMARMNQFVGGMANFKRSPKNR
jgi:hypothetical protein